MPHRCLGQEIDMTEVQEEAPHVPSQEEIAAAVEQLQPVDQRPQTTFPNVMMDLLDPAQCTPGQRILVIQNQQQVLLFPMSVEYAQSLGQKLAAPSVKLATPADAKAAARAMGLPR
jgi:hypothetical protein